MEKIVAQEILWAIFGFVIWGLFIGALLPLISNSPMSEGWRMARILFLFSLPCISVGFLLGKAI